MMMYRLLIFYLLVAQTLTAQEYYNKSPEFLKRNSVWMFGSKAGYDMNTHTPVMKYINTDEACASVTDKNTGELLFYSDAIQAWNKNGIVMSGSTRGAVAILAGSTTTAQGACIVPFVSDPYQYYLFTLQQQGGYGASASSGALSYSVVDMRLNKGLGNVDTMRRNIRLDTALGEMMIAVPGNNCDVWLMVHRTDSAVFKAFHITENGVDPEPVISRTGSEISGQNVYTFFSATPWGAYAIGAMAVSPDRTKLAITASGSVGNITSYNHLITGALLCNFDATTGVVSDAILVDTNTHYGVVFSPDNSKLYLNHREVGIYQYDISKFNKADITASKTLIKAFGTGTIFGLKLYNDTIYLPSGSSGSSSQPYLHRINKPNLSGTACDFEDNAITLLPGAASVYILPNDVIAALPAEISYQLHTDTNICAAKGTFPEMTLSAASGYDRYIWNDGDTGATRYVYEEGTYWVTAQKGCHSRTDTFILQQTDYSRPIINVNINELGTTLPYTTYQWLLNEAPIPGATGRYYTPGENGDYRVITGKGACMDTSDVYAVRNVGINEAGYGAERVKIYPNPTQGVLYIRADVKVDLALYGIDGKLIRKMPCVKEVDIKDVNPGAYFLRIYDQKGLLLKVEKLIKQ